MVNSGGFNINVRSRGSSVFVQQRLQSAGDVDQPYTLAHRNTPSSDT